VRRLATNHFCGYGWWCWMIPLAGGQTSVGVVYQKELFDLPGDAPLRQRYHDFVTSRAGLRELLAPATMDEHDFQAYSHLPYRTSRYMDRGWALLGDAAAFVDPFYSPGLDHCSISIYATARIVEKDLTGKLADPALGPVIDQHNSRFLRSYDRWLDALYDGKYEILGDSELAGCAFLADTALYHAGVVTPVYADIENLAIPLFGLDTPPANFVYRLMSTYNQRLRNLARQRRLAGTYGRRNTHRRSFSHAFGLGILASFHFLARSLRIWLRLEVEQLIHRLRHGRQDISEPVPVLGGRALPAPR